MPFGPGSVWWLTLRPRGPYGHSSQCKRSRVQAYLLVLPCSFAAAHARVALPAWCTWFVLGCFASVKVCGCRPAVLPFCLIVIAPNSKIETALVSNVSSGCMVPVPFLYVVIFAHIFFILVCSASASVLHTHKKIRERWDTITRLKSFLMFPSVFFRQDTVKRFLVCSCPFSLLITIHQPAKGAADSWWSSSAWFCFI